MDEYNSGMDPEVKRLFSKIITSFSWLLLWLVTIATAGLFFKLGEVGNGFKWYNILFYMIALITFILLLRRLLKIWSTTINS